MESSTVMMQASPCFYSSASKKNNPMSVGMDFRKKNSCCFSGGRRKLEAGFYDKDQMDYYSSSSSSSSSSCFRNKLVMKGKEKEEKKEKTMKKRTKLLKGLSRDLSALSQMMMSFDLDSKLGDRVEPNAVSEAAEHLLGQLEKLRAEERELKRKKKEEKAMLKTSKRHDDMSSSSSSESSDSECEEEVVDMDLLKDGESSANQPNEKTTAASIVPPQSIESLLQPRSLTSQPLVPCYNSTDVACNSNSSETSNGCRDVSRICLDEGNKPAIAISEKKIEVCMGGKCKKSGAASLLEEFQKAVGVEVPVMGCKCMGKCRDGPNVRVVNNKCTDAFPAQDSSRTLSSPLCIGVGLEDVDLIVANFLGENQNPVGLATAP